MRLYTPLVLASTATALSGGFGGAAKTKKKKKSAAPLVEESEAYAKLRTLCRGLETDSKTGKPFFTQIFEGIDQSGNKRVERHE